MYDFYDRLKALKDNVGGGRHDACRIPPCAPVHDDRTESATYGDCERVEQRVGQGSVWNGLGREHRSHARDGRDLDAELAECMCRYCNEVLQPLFKGLRSGEIARRGVLAAITPEEMAVWEGGYQSLPTSRPLPKAEVLLGCLTC